MACKATSWNSCVWTGGRYDPARVLRVEAFRFGVFGDCVGESIERCFRKKFSYRCITNLGQLRGYVYSCTWLAVVLKSRRSYTPPPPHYTSLLCFGPTL